MLSYPWAEASNFHDVVDCKQHVSVNPSLSARRIVSRNSPAFELIDRMFNPSHDPPPMDSSAELTKLFQTREASPHDRLIDGSTLLHVSSDLVYFSICKCTED